MGKIAISRLIRPSLGITGMRASLRALNRTVFSSKANPPRVRWHKEQTDSMAGALPLHLTQVAGVK